MGCSGCRRIESRAGSESLLRTAADFERPAHQGPRTRAPEYEFLVRCGCGGEENCFLRAELLIRGARGWGVASSRRGPAEGARGGGRLRLVRRIRPGSADSAEGRPAEDPATWALPPE